eukprot:TRINITY_DN58330_c0_g1_i1.p1 TRINITY_DN58330_c0_g1~~TRINITY_DN58330_c0_g1_i1.p1  ORF type:complete len:392 (+),score=50.06 TRINITY_DN58330_c0_g1_i1:91-1266(+)
MEKLLNNLPVCNNLIHFIARADIPQPQWNMAILLTCRSARHAEQHWHAVLLELMSHRFPAACELVKDARLFEKLALLAALDRSCRQREPGLMRFADLPRAPVQWHREPLFNVDPADVTILTQVWCNGKLVEAKASPFPSPLTGFSYEWAEGMERQELVHTAPLMTDGPAFFTSRFLPKPSQRPAEGSGAVRIAQLPNVAIDFADRALELIESSHVEQELRADCFLVWSRRREKQLRVFNLLGNAPFDIERHLDYLRTELDQGPAHSDFQLDGTGSAIWSLGTRESDLVFVDSHAARSHADLAVASDGIHIKPTIMQSIDFWAMQSWVNLRFRLRSQLEYDASTTKHEENTQRHEILAAGLELFFDCEPENKRTSDAVNIFKALLARLEWTT